jgi:hypothetical protein
MRKSVLLVSGLLSFPVLALDYPEVTDTAQKTALQRFIKDQPQLEADATYTMPASPPALACAVAEIDLYRVLGLQRLHPELRAEQDKQVRKLLRQSGSAASPMKESFSNIRIVPVKAQCASGKLTGDLEFLVSYDSVMAMDSIIPMGDRTVKSTTTISSHETSRIFTSAVAGTPTNASTRMTRQATTVESKFDDAAMQAMQKPNNEPTNSFLAIYISANGDMSSFTLTDLPQVSSGVFGTSVKTVRQLSSTFNVATDPDHMRMQTYIGKQLSMSGNLVGGQMHGEVVSYSENYLKKNNMRLDQQVGMENAREVTINGVDLIETRNCYQQGVPVKIMPCPAQ